MRALRALSIAAAILAIGLVASSAAQAATVRIISPKEDAHLRSGLLRVKVRAHGPLFQAYIDGRQITKRFHRRGSLRSASLRMGRDFGPRDHLLTARVGPRLDSVVDTAGFIAMRRDDGAMTVRYATDPDHRGAHLLSVHTRKRVWDTSRMPRVILNGHRVEDQLTLDSDDHGIAGGLGAEAGLRFGRNHLVVEMLQRDGRYARDVRDFFVPRDRPLAGAGRNITTGVGHPVVLDGSSTKPPPGLGGATVAYHWQLVSAPRGSHAHLSTPDAPRTRFKPKSPGTYVARLTVTPAGGGPAGVDEVTINAPQTASPMGIPIQTIAGNGAVFVGNKFYGSQRSGVLMVVFSATGLTPASGPWGPAVQTFSPSGGHWLSDHADQEKNGCKGDLVTCVRDVDNKNIVVLSGQGREFPGGRIDGSQASDLQKAINDIGGTLTNGGNTPNGAYDLVQGDWSVLGNRILVTGQANQNTFLTQAPIDPKLIPDFPGYPAGTGKPGNLNGFMQSINANAYQYISPEYLGVDTKWTKSPDDAPSPTQNTIMVGGEPHTSDSIPNGAIGFEVLVMSQSAPIQELDKRTFVVLNPDCSTNQDGVNALDQELGNWVNTREGPTTAGSYLMFVQDFGRQNGTCWPGGDSSPWLHDDLPPGVCNPPGNGCFDGAHYPFGWNGQSFPNGTGQLFDSWNRLQNGGTVAGNLGKLAGIPVHDVVANYRRPYYDDNSQQMVNRDFGGLSVVASTHLFQWSSAFHQGQGDDSSLSSSRFPQQANGRVTGVLRRNEQSQWELEAQANGAGWKAGTDSNGQNNGGALDQTAFFDLTFQHPTDWPCTVQHPAPCPNLPSQIRAAHRWFVQQLSPDSSATTVRDLYPQAFPDNPFQITDVTGGYPNPGRGPGYFSPQVFQIMQRGPGGSDSWPGLVGELGDVNSVVKGINNWQLFFEAIADQNARVDIQSVGNKVMTDLQHVYSRLAQKQAEIDGGGILSDAMLFAADLADIAIVATGQEELAPMLAPAIGAATSGMVAANTTANTLAGDGPSSGQGNVPNASDAIQDQVSQLSYDVNKRYQTIAAGLSHFGGIFVDDWGKLRTAAANFDTGGPWQLTTATVNSLGQSIAGEAETSMYETALPITYRQWIVSPRKTTQNRGGPGELASGRDYQCQQTYNEDPRPFHGSSTYGMDSIGWTGGGSSGDMNSSNSTNFTLRGLKSVADDLSTATYSYYDEKYFSNVSEASIGDQNGTSAAQDLMQPLFGSISTLGTATDPGPLGASKEEVFGLPSWTMEMLSCGSPPLSTSNGPVDDGP